jgi:hypothetical protein
MPLVLLGFCAGLGAGLVFAIFFEDSKSSKAE